VYARVTRWENSTAEAQKAAAEMINSSDGPPEGVPAKGITVLDDHESGRSITITLFDSEEDRRVGDEALKRMNPPGDAGEVVSTEFYELTVDRRI